jgi:hypothetical protein
MILGSVIMIPSILCNIASGALLVEMVNKTMSE